MDFQNRFRCHFLHDSCSKAKGNRYKWIVAPGRCNGIQFDLYPLITLLHLTFYLSVRICFGAFVNVKSLGRRRIYISTFNFLIDILIFFQIFLKGFLCIGTQHFIDLRYCKAAILLGSCHKNDISHNIKSSIQCLWFVVPDIPHLKATL